jgi:hypothetical protein
MNELTQFYGADKPSRTYKWGVASHSEFSDWRIVAWFTTRKRAEAYGASLRGDHAVCRLGRIAGRLI